MDMRKPKRIPRVVMAKIGLDGHSRGVYVVAHGLRQAGMEVIYTGLRQTPSAVANAAVQESAHVIGISSMVGAHLSIVRKLKMELEGLDASDIPIILGGIISEEEFQKLYAQNRKDYQPTVKKKLKQGYIIIAEDYVGTGLAWGSAKGAGMAYLKKINKGILKEDLAILLDGKRFKAKKDHILHETDEALIRKVRKQHLKLAKEYRWKIINANQSREKVFEQIKKEVNKLLP